MQNIEKFDKQDEDDEVLEGNELYISLNNNVKLTEAGIDKIDIRSQLKQQIKNQQTKVNGWRFDKLVSRTKDFN